MSMWLMYLILKLDDVQKMLDPINFFLIFVLVIGILGLSISYIVTSCCVSERDDEWKGCQNYIKNIFPKLLKVFKLLLVIEICVILLFVFLPTTKQAAAIYFVPKVINNKQIQKMPNKLVQLANSWMDEQIKSIKKIDK